MCKPKTTHIEYMSLTRENRIIVNKLAALLRMAEALDAGHNIEPERMKCRLDSDNLIVSIPGMPDLAFKRKTFAAQSDMFEDIFCLNAKFGRRLKKYMDKNIKFNSPHLFVNRELSWLEFNHRVLLEGLEELPLLERLKFLSIVSSNLDEFFMIRVAGLVQQTAAGIRKRDKSGLTPTQQLKHINLRVHKMIDTQPCSKRRYGKAQGTRLVYNSKRRLDG